MKRYAKAHRISHDSFFGLVIEKKVYVTHVHRIFIIQTKLLKL